VRSAAPGLRKIETARSCAITSPRTWPVTSAATWTYHTWFGLIAARFGSKVAVPKRSQPYPKGSEIMNHAACPWRTSSEK
jgi:hypothetical protein